MGAIGRPAAERLWFATAVVLEQTPKILLAKPLGSSLHQNFW